MKILITVAFGLLTFSTFAQLSGEVFYTTTVNMHKGLPNDERGERMKAWIPEFQEFKNQLLFTPEKTLYKNIHDVPKADLSEEDRNAWMKRRMAPEEDVIFCDVAKGLTVASKEFMDKTFLIRDTLKLARWKITGEQQEIAGMNCLRAEFIPEAGDTSKIWVWFTTEIAISSGPAGYGGLPGLIVYLDKNDSQVVIALSRLIMREIAANEIEEPVKGKEVTQAEFDEMRRKKMEERQTQGGGRGGGMH